MTWPGLSRRCWSWLPSASDSGRRAREIKEALGQVQAETAPQPIDADHLRTRIRELEKQRDAALQKARQLEEQIAALRTQLELPNPKRRMRGRAAA